MATYRSRATDQVFDELMRSGIRAESCEAWGPTLYAPHAMKAFHSLAETLTAREMDHLNELLFNIRMNQETMNPEGA